jgi:hypothetical protein
VIRVYPLNNQRSAIQFLDYVLGPVKEKSLPIDVVR